MALFAAFFPVGMLADISNSGTLFAFAMVAIAVMVLRKTDPGPQPPVPDAGDLCHGADRDHRLHLPVLQPRSTETKLMFLVWAAIGLVVYFAYSRSRSHVGLGHIEVHEDDPDAPPPPVPPAPSFS